MVEPPGRRRTRNNEQRTKRFSILDSQFSILHYDRRAAGIVAALGARHAELLGAAGPRRYARPGAGLGGGQHAAGRARGGRVAAAAWPARKPLGRGARPAAARSGLVSPP